MTNLLDYDAVRCETFLKRNPANEEPMAGDKNILGDDGW